MRYSFRQGSSNVPFNTKETSCSYLPHEHVTARACVIGLTVVFLLLSSSAARPTPLFETINLVTDDPTVHAAQITDPSLVNPWGVSFSPTSPFWVSDNGTGVATLYNVNPTTNNTTKFGLTVTIPGDGSVTGQVFNSSSTSFNGDRFLFGSEDGTISGWRSSLGTAAEVLQLSSTSNVYKGEAIAAVGGHTYLYSANFRAGTIDILKGDAAAPDLAGKFVDPTIPSGYAPFNIGNIGGNLYVTYAKQDADKKDDVPGFGNGFVSEFDLNGNFIKRVATAGTLDSPWGLTIAPASFGALAGDLLVGNFGDGRINAFDLSTDSFVGQLQDFGGPLAIDGLWALTLGNDGSAGNSQSIYFSSGPDGESHGVFGVIVPAPEPGSIVLFGTALILLLAFRRRRA